MIILIEIKWQFIENIYKIKVANKICDIMKINSTKDCLEEDKKSFQHGTTIFECAFNNNWMDWWKVKLFIRF